MSQNLSKETDYLIIVPIYNESLIIQKTIANLFGFFTTKWPQEKSWRLVIADNGSRDDSGQIVKQLQKQYPDQLDYLFIPEAGRGRALRTVGEKYSAKYYLYIDADLPIELADIAKLFQPLETGQADLVLIKRTGQRPLHRQLLTFFPRLIVYLLFNLRLSDIQCGIKAFNQPVKPLLLNCRENGWFLDTELVVASQQQNLKIQEIPTDWLEQRYPERKTKVKFIRSSLNFIKATLKIANRLFPNYLIYFLLLVSLGGCSLLAVILNKLYISNPAPILPEHLKEFSSIIKLYDWFFGLTFLVLCLSLKKIKKIPANLVYATIITFLILIAIVTTATLPTHSQDIYWNLLLTKGFVYHGLNPYQTSPDDLVRLNLQDNNFYHYVKIWLDQKMTHGPGWVLFLAAIILIFPGFLLPIVSIKIIMFGLLAATLWLIYKTTSLLNFPADKKITTLILLAWNPLLIQTILVDNHNDTFLLFGVTLSFYYFLKKKYFPSIIPLLLAGFIKYVTWPLMLIPLIALLREQKNYRQIISKLLLTGLMVILAFIIFYAPFGPPWHNLSGLNTEYTTRCYPTEMMVGAATLLIWLKNAVLIRHLGLAVFLLLLIYLTKKRLYSAAYFLPLACLFFFFTPWFQPWYLLWILPGLILYLPTFWFITISLLMFSLLGLMSTLAASTFIIEIIFLHLAYQKILKREIVTGSGKNG